MTALAQREPTRTRRQGTRVTSTKDGAQIIAACRAIMANGQYAKINGQMVDLFTASAIVKVYDALNETNKAKIEALSIERMASIAMRLLS